MDDASKCLDELIQTFKKYNLTLAEILRCYGNLGYTLGASIEGLKGKGPTIKELELQYYTNARPGIALMIQGYQITTWEQDLFTLQEKETEKENNDKETD